VSDVCFHWNLCNFFCSIYFQFVLEIVSIIWFMNVEPNLLFLSIFCDSLLIKWWNVRFLDLHFLMDCGIAWFLLFIFYLKNSSFFIAFSFPHPLPFATPLRIGSSIMTLLWIDRSFEKQCCFCFVCLSLLAYTSFIYSFLLPFHFFFPSLSGEIPLTSLILPCSFHCDSPLPTFKSTVCCWFDS
jgi:hypothetical protein